VIDLSLFVVGLLIFIALGAVVVTGFVYYRRNVKAGAEDTDPDKFTQ
jgi:tellurite resistance protein TehA-like permease